MINFIFTVMLLVSIHITCLAMNIKDDNHQDYYTDNFGFGVVNIGTYTHCTGDFATDGVVILLGNAATCGDVVSADVSPRIVSAYGAFNMADGFKTAWKVAKHYCREHKGHSPWSHQYALDGRKSSGCRIDYPDGRIEIISFALRKTDIFYPESWVQVALRLVTT